MILKAFIYLYVLYSFIEHFLVSLCLFPLSHSHTAVVYTHLTGTFFMHINDIFISCCGAMPSAFAQLPQFYRGLSLRRCLTPNALRHCQFTCHTHTHRVCVLLAAGVRCVECRASHFLPSHRPIALMSCRPGGLTSSYAWPAHTLIMELSYAV